MVSVRNWTLREVAERVGCCKMTIGRWASELGLGVRVGATSMVVLTSLEAATLERRARERANKPPRGARLGGSKPAKKRRR